jgi:hypothetical protein
MLLIASISFHRFSLARIAFVMACCHPFDKPGAMFTTIIDRVDRYKIALE